MSDEELIKWTPYDSKNLNRALARKVAHVFKWDPEDKENKKDINLTKLNHIFKRHWAGTEFEKKITDITGDTLYNSIAAHPAANKFFYMAGVCTEEDLLELTKKPKLEGNNRYPFVINKGKDFVETLRTIQRDVTYILKSGASDEEFDIKKVKNLNPGKGAAVNAILKGEGVPDFDLIVDFVQSAGDKQSKLEKEAKKHKMKVTTLEGQVEHLQESLRTAAASSPITEVIEFDGDPDTSIPEGKLTTRKASELFPTLEFKTDLEVPFFEWDGQHPNVPAIDPNYVFRVKELTRCLYGLTKNKRTYLSGHTGTGKTTLLEQMAAHLNYPFIRVNMDSEITRMDFIGRDTMTVDEEGHTISKFIDGILPKAMISPCLFVCDEIDFCRPDVAYAMQAALEGNGLRITEDGDRFVNPHPMFRMFATGNTVGQGDEEGMYQGARPQSMALLDRFTVWIKVDYLTKEERAGLIRTTYPALGLAEQEQLSNYVTEHLEAFMLNKIMQPISPRGMLAIAESTLVFGDFGEALRMCVLDRASNDDRATLVGIIDRYAKA